MSGGFRQVERREPLTGAGRKLNLGCGHRRLDGYVNVDQADCGADVRHDLEDGPWPFVDGFADEVVATHVLEHIHRFDLFVTEVYRVLAPGGLWRVAVPHPRSEGFLGDPTHVRPITLATLTLLSRKKCAEFRANGWPNTPLAEYWGVDFEVERTEVTLMPGWIGRSAGLLDYAMLHLNNVVDEVRFWIRRV